MKLINKITKTAKKIVNKIKSIVRNKEAMSSAMDGVGTVAGAGASIVMAVVLKPYVKNAGLKLYQEALASIGLFFMSSFLSRAIHREVRVYYNDILDFFGLSEYAIEKVRVAA